MIDRRIGVFDSGVGGLSILRELTDLLPGESFFYLADQAHVPYGTRPLNVVRGYSESIVRFLISQKSKLLVVACNTASAAALHHLRRVFPDVPFVGMEPAVKPAARSTRSMIVGVLATTATFQGELFASVVERFAGGVQLVEVVLPGLVEAIETGDLGGGAILGILETGLAPLKDTPVDTVVLACTHYPFVIPQIRRILGPEVEVIDPSPAIARQAGRLLDQHRLGAPETHQAQIQLCTTGDPANLKAVAEQLIGFRGEVLQAVWLADQLSLSRRPA